MMRVVFFGTPELAVPFLQALAQDAQFEVVGVVTMPDKPSGRGKQLAESPIKRVAQAWRATLFQPERLKDPVIIESLKKLDADAFVVVAYGKIIPPTILAIPRLGCVNVHPSLLPAWRGPSPRQAAIEAGDQTSGVTIMVLDEGMDTGPLLASKKIPLAKDETTESFTKKVCEEGPFLLLETLRAYAAGTLSPKPQDNTKATMSRLFTREDGKVNWKEPAETIERKFRAYQPWPGLWSAWNRNGKSMRLKWEGLAIAKNHTLPPGKVLVEDEHFFVGTGAGTIEITALQPEGKPPMTSRDFLHGYSDVSGATLG